jgi:dienelactone hydrolase
MGLLGFSLGGLLAASVTARVNAYKALVLWAPTTVNNLCRIAGQAEPGMPVTRGVHVLNPKFFDDIRTLDSIGDSVKHPRPTLLIQGTADTAVPPAVSQEYVDTMRRHNVDLSVEMIGDADHVFSKLPQRTKLLDTTVGWLENHLL